MDRRLQKIIDRAGTGSIGCQGKVDKKYLSQARDMPICVLKYDGGGDGDRTRTGLVAHQLPKLARLPGFRHTPKRLGPTLRARKESAPESGPRRPVGMMRP